MKYGIISIIIFSISNIALAGLEHSMNQVDALFVNSSFLMTKVKKGNFTPVVKQKYILPALDQEGLLNVESNQSPTLVHVVANELKNVKKHLEDRLTRMANSILGLSSLETKHSHDPVKDYQSVAYKANRQNQKYFAMHLDNKLKIHYKHNEYVSLQLKSSYKADYIVLAVNYTF